MALLNDQINPLDFASKDDVIQKLARTVVLYKSKPVYVHTVVTKNKLIVYGADKVPVEVGLDEVDYQAPKLGMFYDPACQFAIMPRRYAYRQYRGGLPMDSVQLMLCSGAYCGNTYNVRDSLEIVMGEEFTNMLHNKYRTVTECMALIDGFKARGSVPFRKFHWITKEKNLVRMMFKDQMLASYDFKTKEFTQGNTAVYADSSLISLVHKQIKEFEDYVTSA